MASRRPTIYLIAGCNGAGKTTFAQVFLRKEVKVLRFINADEIARGLSPLKPEALAIRAGKLLLEEVHACVERKESFALESTLSGRTYLALFQRARAVGYRIELHYLWLENADMAVMRVRKRVLFQKGHDVPEEDIRRRFKRSLQNVLNDYLPLMDRWVFWNNVRPPAKMLASSETHSVSELKELL